MSAFLSFSSSSIETAKQKLEKDRLRREAELKITGKRKKLAELQKKFKELLNHNQSLPEHVRLTPVVQKHIHWCENNTKRGIRV